MAAAAAAHNLEMETQLAVALVVLAAAARAVHIMTDHLFLQRQPHNLLCQLTERPTPAVAAAVQNATALQQAERAAPASSSCPTQWPLARRSFSNPRHRGLPQLAQRRLIIWL